MDLEALEYTSVNFTKGNVTVELTENGADVRINAPLPFPATALLLLANTTTSPRKNLAANSSRNEFQFYLIGVYSFFAFLFGIGILVILCQKLQKACCSPHDAAQRDDWESLLHHHQLDGSDLDGSPVFEHRVTVDDYETYSGESDHETDPQKDRPPDYEHPPSYTEVKKARTINERSC